jgi:Mn2+/Fe2+ NRAMP family transporter
VSDESSGYPQDRPYDQPQQPYQAAYPPPAYGTDQIRFQAPGPTVEHPRATLAFVLGLLSVLGLTILGPFGWYLGNKVVAEIDRDPRTYANRGIAMAGKVLGIIGTVFLALTVALVVALVVFAVVASSSSA